jgi:hypothetical protein
MPPTSRPRKSLYEARGDLPGRLIHTTQEDSTLDTSSTPISIHENQTETAPAAPTPKSRRRPSSEPTSLGTRKTSFMLDERGRAALEELMPMWKFASLGAAVTEALCFLLHEAKRERVFRLPAEE